MGEQLQQGLKLRNKREIGVGPLKFKNQLERQELSQTRSHSKCAGSHRAQRESKGRGRIPPPPQKEILPSTKDNLQT